MTAGTNQPDTTSASRWIGARLRCASRTIATICASSVSAPTRSARMTKLPVPLTVPPMTRSPGALLDRHRLAGDHRLVDGARPSSTTPSTGTFSPGRTRSRSPTLHLRRAERPPRCRRRASRRAVFGARPSSARMAAPVWLRARSSSTWPSSTSVTITAAPRSRPPTCAVLIAERRRETARRDRRDDAVAVRDAPTPSAISVNMFRLRFDDRRPAAHEERPAAPEHDRRRERELEPRDHGAALTPRQRSGQVLAHRERAASGAVSAALTQKRRVMSASSGFGLLVQRDGDAAPAPCRRSGTRPARLRTISRVHRARVLLHRRRRRWPRVCSGRGR